MAINDCVYQQSDKDVTTLHYVIRKHEAEDCNFFPMN